MKRQADEMSFTEDNFVEDTNEIIFNLSEACDQLAQINLLATTEKEKFEDGVLNSLQQLTQSEEIIARDYSTINKIKHQQNVDSASIDMLAKNLITDTKKNIISLSISGTVFTTTRTTLLRFPESLFAVMIRQLESEGDTFMIEKDTNGALIINERPATHFPSKNIFIF